MRKIPGAGARLGYAAPELMVVVMARLLSDATTVFTGVASYLPVLAVLLARRLYNPDLVWLNIPGRVNPAPSRIPRSTVHPALAEGGEASLTLAEIFDLSARGELDVAFLSGVQVDRTGAINLSRIEEGGQLKVQLTGGAGSALIYPTARRTLLWRAKHDTRSLVERVSVATAAGNIYRLVTPLALFRPGKEGLELESIHPWASLEEVRAATGFPVGEAPTTPPPRPEELRVLREIDPEKLREIEFS